MKKNRKVKVNLPKVNLPNKATRQLYMSFVGGTAMVLLIAIIFATVMQFVLDQFGIIGNNKVPFGIIAVSFCVISVTIGFALAFLVAKFIMKPIKKLLVGMSRLSQGRYRTRLNFGEKHPLSSIAGTFNGLAGELEKTEILRSDFINNFSHELKTPIVSIKGLVTLMKSGKISPEKQREYLDIIEEESDRLSMMTTNVLSLSKIENQTMLVDKCKYNLSEQLRMSLLLFEKNWTEKQLKITMDFDEYYINASEDLLKQVWLNLIDNAIKFSYIGGDLIIGIEEIDGKILVSVGNNGNEINDEEKAKIFAKFYQTDKAHTRAGNGIGLSIVKSIVTLHGGEVDVTSEGGINTFRVELPKGEL